MTLVRRVNNENTNVTEVMRVENGVVTNIGEIIQVENGVLTTRFTTTAGGGSTEFKVNGADGEVDDAGIDFAVSRSGEITLSLTAGTFKGTNYTPNVTGVDPQNIGAVTVDTTRTLTGSVVVPDTAMWSNRGEDVTITNFSVTQLGPFTPDPAEDRNRYTETFLDNVDAYDDVSNGSSEKVDCSTEDDVYLHQKLCYTQTTTSGHTPRYTLTCIAPDGCDLADGTIVDHGPVETGSTEEEVCGTCSTTLSLNPNFEGPTFDLDAIYDADGYFTAYVNSEDGSVSTGILGVVFLGVTTQLQTGQTDPFPVLPNDYVNADGNSYEDRTVNLEVTGTIPDGYTGQGGDIDSADFRVSVTARQFPASAVAPTLGVQVKYYSTEGGIVTLVVKDEDDITLTNFREGIFEGYYFNTLPTRPLGTPITFDPEGSFRPGKGFAGTLTGREHTITATNTAGSDSFTFTITTDALE